jgi:hypothetical protein
MVRIICAIALLCVGFAHKAPTVESAALSYELASDTLPDESFPIICQSHQDGHEKHHGLDHKTGCEACYITSSIVLSEPADSIGQAIVVGTKIQRPLRRDIFYRQLFPPNTSPRGPPTGLIG